MLGIGFAAAVGCGGPYDSSVSGSVLLDGNAIETGTVSFIPMSGGPAAYARIGAGGEYTIRTGREDGLPSGEYAVTVVAHEPSTVLQTADGGPPPAGKLLTPEWYRSAESSGLKYTVTPGRNKITIELSTEAPPGWKPKPPTRRRR
ncbi:hypothetical protein Pla175_36350 [Pirellulimonas nuda]|uniref:Carboxypeptidase regulatory-like domain-containing protein n=2 Tax=Pirellulimonas nuda TaxID=2528009 RepID=A0A518DFH5_9BACT|nr:hypothetical protein Pla175_36350 [Pirellulimonas nuda]